MIQCYAGRAMTVSQYGSFVKYDDYKKEVDNLREQLNRTQALLNKAKSETASWKQMYMESNVEGWK